MNFYKHHLGDYAQATGHLSFVEDAAYSRLLRKYYAEERPIPGDLKAAQRLVGARSREEKEAVQTVLEEFFELDAEANVWRNKRAEEELAKASAQAETNRRIAEEREAKKRARTKNEASTNRAENGNESSHDQSTKRQPSQTPDSRHQYQEQKPTPSSSVAGQPARSDDDDPPVPGEQDLPSWIPKPLWREFYRHREVLRKPLSIPGQRQVVQRLIELSEAGHDIASSLRQTMAAGLAIPVIPKDPDHANVPAGRKLSAVDQVAAAIRERRAREHPDDNPDAFALGHG